ncbi:hypothetical protein [Rhizobium laguerreae]|uniref:hypothetical protein n=1 Tax=Rhizobium laguerreae TaxID=1076926 RepID=UPI001FEC6746|nr:hypothetical protein [Rhizobium laguerreae]
MKAKEYVRQRVQGFGRPIISAVLNGQRLVIVGARSRAIPEALTFHQFLVENMKDVIGREWGGDASKSALPHPLFRWLKDLNRSIQTAWPKQNFGMSGSVSALIRFSYCLYLLEHNDKHPASLVARLKQPSEFIPAVYETFVAGAFAVAGATIDGAEDVRSAASKPEFIATFASGRRYEIEAKKKSAWATQPELRDPQLQAELKKWVRNRLYSSAKKELQNPVYWLELSLPLTLEQGQAEALNEIARDAVRAAEDITIAGNPVRPAYVVITNNSDLAGDGVAGGPFFATLVGFAMPSFREGEFELEEALDLHDEHRDIRRVIECMKEVDRIPPTFDGTPEELIGPGGKPVEIVQIGDRIEYVIGTKTHTGRVEEIAAVGESAAVIVTDENSGRQVIGQIPLNAEQAAAASRLGNSVFGKPEGPKHDLGDDLFAIYDRMLEIYEEYPREGLLRHLASHTDLAEFEKLGLSELRRRAARESAKSIYVLPNSSTPGQSPPQQRDHAAIVVDEGRG